MEQDPSVMPLVFELAIGQAVNHLMEARKVLESLFVSLSEEERKHLPPVPAEIGTVGDAVLQAAEEKPELETVCKDYDPELIREGLDKGAKLVPLLNQLAAFSRVASDTRNATLAGAYRSLLAVYRVTKTLEESDSSYAPIALPLHEMFAKRKKGKKKEA